jgi:glycosyltransferase involved in cell wall biosynthesis
MLTTMHCMITPDTQRVWDDYHGFYNSISLAQKQTLPASRNARFAGAVHNAIDVPSFPFQAKKDDHLLYLSRISPEKGPETAIEVARRTGKQLIIAGKVDPADRDYYREHVAPQIDGYQVRFLGEADATLKRELYKRASCLLMPITWEEPFGLVMAEAQACGTPVVTFGRGAAPEIVRHGETGFVVDTIEEMVASVGRLKEIDPLDCRENVERRFDAPTMAANYVQVYRSIVESEPVRKSDALVPAAETNGHKQENGRTTARVA